MSLGELLKLERPLFVFDLETTSTQPKTARIVEIGFQCYKPQEPMKEWRSLINPEMHIPPETTKLHHITDADMKGCQRCGRLQGQHTDTACEGWRAVPPWRQVAQSFAKGFSGCDFAGKNIRFDLQVLSAEMARCNVPWSYAGALILDADRLERLLEPRDLSALYRRRLGKEPLDAHTALADVRMTAEILEDQLVKGSQKLPPNLRALHALQWPGWLDTEGKFTLQNGVPTCTFGKYRDVPMKNIPLEYWSWIHGAGSDFSEEIRTIARNAMEGKFPNGGDR